MDKQLLAAICAGILSMCLLSAAGAATVPGYLTFNFGGFGQNLGTTLVVGVDFRAEQDIIIEELGHFDGLADGLDSTYPMGLFNTLTTALLATTTLPSGTGGRLDGPASTSGILAGQWRYAALAAPVALAAGTEFTVAALRPQGSMDESPLAPAFTMNPAVTFQGRRLEVSNVLLFPNQFINAFNDHPVGFTFSTALVPLPAAVWLFGGGLIGLLVVAKRRID
jgi:hypothetical protein